MPRNSGNSCYANTVLQLLRTCEDVVEGFCRHDCLQHARGSAASGPIWRQDGSKMRLEGLLGASRSSLGASWERLGASWGPLGDLLGASWRHLGPSAGVVFTKAKISYVRIRLRCVLEPSWGRLGAVLGPSWGHLGAILGPSWSHLGAILGHLGPS